MCVYMHVYVYMYVFTHMCMCVYENSPTLPHISLVPHILKPTSNYIY